MQEPLISIIIPVYNGRHHLQRCLAALYQTTYLNWECIIVDDGSTDGSPELAQQYGAVLLHTSQAKSGPAVARNLGAQSAGGDILFFIDADILVYPDSLHKVAANFQAGRRPIAACFGSYDDEPAEPNFLSQYKNLQHHYVHQSGSSEASTFWSGCGAIRREIFLEMGGFPTHYGRPSIEDIELGYRLRAAGHHIHLDKSLQVKHLKKWTLSNLLRTDIFDRAIPWSRLILQSSHMLNDLNLQTGQRASAVLLCLGLFCLAAGLLFPPLWLLIPLFLSGLLLLNRPFYRYLARKRTPTFALKAIPIHWLYFLYSTLAFAAVWLEVRREK
jgi:glycosyltransferase involved in cell wall biosynthesis